MPDRSRRAVAVVRSAVGTRARRRLLAVVLLVGLLTAVAVATATAPAGRTFAGLTAPVQLVMSVGVPCTGVLLGRDLATQEARPPVLPSLLGAGLVAAGAALVGVLATAGVLGVVGSRAADPWAGAAAVTLGSVLVQVLAQLVGTGLGLLIPSVTLACLSTVVLPLGLWAVLGASDALRPARGWLTPFATTGALLAGRMTAVAWARWLVVVLLWGVGLNLLGVLRARSERAAGPAAP
ncbi:hypothetical protein SAMN04488543_0651 [Friedmanniella luteola]|uniref:Uncharacterized protein n=1 Tax=Friedmanniella luteola TaxID=546871 RepID=A0A1H1MK91_9ACTN|nr:hypothetical protein [Friedmanniella luteola]SDR86775.1 hypothetical protein SAMN04488543_0651 [Friedmanniella luteola]